MKKIIPVTLLICFFAVNSCKKSNQDSSAAATPSINDIVVPAGFNWESSRTVNVTAAITDTRFSTALHTISVYNGDPNAGGALLTRGSASTLSAFTAKIYIPTALTQVYVVKTSPDKSSITNKVTLGTGDINLSFGATDPSVTAVAPTNNKQILGATSPSSPGCGTGTIITANTQNLNVNNGDTYTITGSNITVNFSNVNGGTIIVCGTNVTLQNLSFNGAAALEITSGASVSMSSLNFNNSSASIQNWGTVNFSGSFPDNGIFSNYATFNCSGDFNENSNAGIFTNNGTMNISGSFNDGTSAVATNNATMTVSANFQPNSNSAFVNNCTLTVGANYNQSSGVKNYNLINVAGTTTINGSTELGLYNSAMLKTGGLIVDGTINGYGSTSLVEITGSTTIRNQGSVIDNVQVYSTSQTLDSTSASKITTGATQGNSVYIATGGCNSIGNGSPAVVDTDGDGVPDSQDAYPTDPTRAYNVTGASGTVAYEDQWPSKGDFDMNDMVMSYSYSLVTSAKNIVVSVSASYTLYATGGTLSNGFGIEFPVSPSLVSGLAVTSGSTPVTNPTFESGQAKAVVILFYNMRNEMATWNTMPGITLTPPKSYALSFNIANGPTLATFGQDEYNPFLFNYGRAREVHVMGKTPTSVADQTLFGTADDNTSVSAGRYYVTKTGLPYAINLPIIPFSYPIEGVDITKVYLHLGDWATSNGSSYTDWYSNTGTGYRNVANIFTK